MRGKKKKKKDATGSRSQYSVGNEAHTSARAEKKPRSFFCLISRDTVIGYIFLSGHLY